MVKPTDLNFIEVKDHRIFPKTRKCYTTLTAKSFDTETDPDGFARLIADNSGAYRIIYDFEDALTFLTFNANIRTVNFFFNLEFDTNAIFKHLSSDQLDRLGRYNILTYHSEKLNSSFEIFFIPKKYLVFRNCDDPKKEYRFFDIAQFYQLGGLEKTYSKTFCCAGLKLSLQDKRKCELSKNCDNCPVLGFLKGKRFKKSVDASKGFWLDQINREVIDYCISDCVATQRLSQHFVDVCNRIVPIKRFFSPATLAKEILKQNLKRPYQFKKNQLQQYALNSFAGGRIETILRGNFDKAYLYDIVSAYPSIQCELFSVGDRPYDTVRNAHYNKDSHHSFYCIDVDIPKCTISPIKYRHNHMLIYPTGKLKHIYVSKCEYELLEDIGCDITIRSAIHNFGDFEKPFEYMKELFKQRQIFKERGDPLQLVLKLALNSSYGICVERNGKQILADFDVNLLDKFDVKVISEDGIDKLLYKEYTAGVFFNPVYAAEITAEIRCKLYRDCIKHEDHVIKFSTDSIAFDKKIKLDFGKNLGQYDDSKAFEALVIGNGVYTFRNEIKTVSKFRSFGKDNIFDIAEENLDARVYKQTRKSPRKLLESRKGRYAGFNTFLDKTKDLDINFDKKRLWDRSARSFNDLLKNKIGSKPIAI